MAFPASADILLTFEGIPNATAPGNFYAGGAGGSFGITFSPNASTLIDSDAGGTGENVLFNGTAQSVVLSGFNLYDDMRFGTVPEPGSLLLAGCALLAAFVIRESR